MRVTVRFFATLRDRAGTDKTSVEIGDAATVAALLDRLVEDYPALKPYRANTLVSVNEEYAFPPDPLKDGDEIALFPPVSGGAKTPYPEYFAITSERLDLDAIVAAITEPETGAVCLFTGAVRGTTYTGEGRLDTDHLVYESYIPMAEKKLRQVADEIRERYPKVRGIAIVQRIGKLAVGDTTVLVACASGHRHDGIFEAARYGIDRLKEIVPIWKKEVGPDGSAWVEGHYHPSPADARQREGTPVREASFRIGCPSCGEFYPYDTRQYRCPCGKPFEVIDAPPFKVDAIEQETFSMWRYRAMLAPPNLMPVTLGEGWTPLIRVQVNGRAIYLKLESTNPTGSFKDRGASLLVSMLKAHNITPVHDDSSGNAGAALAAYAAQAGIEARLYVPAYASPTKLAQIALYGAKLEPIDGPRSAASLAAQEVADKEGSFYASHVYHPFASFANKSIAYELWEQNRKRAPDAIILPVGHGTQLLGLAWGFADLQAAGLIERAPRLIGVQARSCAPIWAHYHGIESGGEGSTVAEGIRIAKPTRIDSILAAIRASRGEVVTVDEAAIISGLRQLARYGISAEPTSAVVWPAFEQVKEQFPEQAVIVIIITGSGLKTPNLQQLVLDS